MRRVAAAVLGLAAAIAGYALGRETAAPPSPATVIRERVVGTVAPPILAPEPRCDEAARAAAVVRALQVDLAPEPEPPQAPTETAEAATERALEVLARARAARRFSERDADALRQALPDMTPEQRDGALRDLAAALSRNEIVPDTMPPL